MKHGEKLEVGIDKNDPVNGLRKAVQFHLTKQEQIKLINELLKVLPEPSELIKKYASYFSNMKEEGGYWNAGPNECWIMAKQDYESEVKNKNKRIVTKVEK